MTPDPTPVSGMTPLLPALVVPVTVIRTTAGLTLDATAIVADDSSMATGWTVPTLVACGTLADAGAGRSSAPAAVSAATVPTDARTADRIDATTSEPPRRSERLGGTTAPGGGGGAGGPVPRVGGTGGGSPPRRDDGLGRRRRRGRLVPSFGSHGCGLAPRAGPVGARLRARRVACRRRAVGIHGLGPGPGRAIRGRGGPGRRCHGGVAGGRGR